MNWRPRSCMYVACAATFAALPGCFQPDTSVSELRPEFRVPRESMQGNSPPLVGLYVGRSVYLQFQQNNKTEIAFYEHVNGNPFGRKVDLFANQPLGRSYDASGPAYIPQRDAVAALSFDDTSETHVQLASLRESNGAHHVERVNIPHEFVRAPKVSPGDTAIVAIRAVISDTILLFQVTDSLRLKSLGILPEPTQRFQFAWIGPETLLRIVSGTDLQVCTIKNGVIQEGEKTRLEEGFYSLPEFQPLDGRRIICRASTDIDARSTDHATQDVIVYSKEGLPEVIGTVPIEGRCTFLAEKNKLIALTTSGAGRAWNGREWKDFQIRGTVPFSIGVGVAESGACACVVAVDSAGDVWVID